MSYEFLLSSSWSLWCRSVLLSKGIQFLSKGFSFLLPASCSHQGKMMVFHWIMCDSKFPKVSRTLFSILAVFIVSIRPSISSSFSFLFQFFGPFQVRQSQLVLPSPPCSKAFLVPWKGPSTRLSFCFLRFSLSVPLGWQSSLYGKFSSFFSFFYYHKAWSSSQHYVIYLYIKLPSGSSFPRSRI